MLIPKVIPAGQFKQHCLALIDQVAQGEFQVIITKHGKKKVRIIAEPEETNTSIFGIFPNSVSYSKKEITSPVDEKWEALK